MRRFKKKSYVTSEGLGSPKRKGEGWFTAEMLETPRGWLGRACEFPVGVGVGGGHRRVEGLLWRPLLLGQRERPSCSGCPAAISPPLSTQAEHPRTFPSPEASRHRALCLK